MRSWSISSRSWVAACAAILAISLSIEGFPRGLDRGRRENSFTCGTHAQRDVDALARSQYEESRLRRPERIQGSRAPTPGEKSSLTRDVGDVAVMEDDGTILTLPNAFDLEGRAFRFEPAAAGGYRVLRSDAKFDAAGGSRINLSDDDTASVGIGFPFSFYGSAYSTVQVNSDGNLTFSQADTASTERDLGRFVSGPPRIGPLFADLDPSRGGGSILVRGDSTGIAFLWSAVPEFASGDVFKFNSFAVKLFRDGSIEFAYGAQVDSADAVVGISPGSRIGGIASIDYASDPPTQAQTGTLVEVFASRLLLSETAVARKFFETHPDRFDHINVFLGFDYDLGAGAYAYEINVKNEIRGIGLEVEDSTQYYGSNGQLRSFLNMGTLTGFGRYPDDPDRVFLGTNSTMGIMGQESGHRWLVFTPFRDGNADSKAILGRDEAHWSFFFNSNGSVMEGNAIEDRGANRGGDRFLTIGATNTFSLFDQYMMGLVGKQEVPPSFLVENPSGTSRRPASNPQIGVMFGGSRKEVPLESVIAANGPRVPSVAQAPKVFRQAFIYLTRRGEPAADSQVSKVQRIRDAWVRFFNEQTQGRGWVVTDLQNGPGTARSTILFPYFQGNISRYTGIALANYGATPADLLLTAFDNSGAELAAPPHIVNPRMLTIAPGAQVAQFAEQIHGLNLSDARNGWIRAESTSGQVAGFFLDGDIDQTFLSGAAAGNARATELLFGRAQLASASIPGNGYRNLLNIVNPDNAPATVSLTLHDPAGTPRESASRVVPASGRLAEDLALIFPSAVAPRLSGYVRVLSDRGVVGYQSVDTGSTLFSLPALSPSAAPRLYSAQFASGRAGDLLYFTEINLINASAQPRNVEVRLVGNDGLPPGGAASPARLSLAPGQQVRVRGEVLFGLPDPALGAPLVQGSLLVSADGSGIAGDVTFGDVSNGRFLASLPLDAEPLSRFVLAQVAQGRAGGTKAYFTGVAIFNPGPSPVEVTLEVYSAQGALTGRRQLPLVAGGRVTGTLPELVHAIQEQVRGHIRVTVQGGAVSAYGLFGDQGLSFLAAIPPQAAIF